MYYSINDLCIWNVMRQLVFIITEARESLVYGLLLYHTKPEIH